MSTCNARMYSYDHWHCQRRRWHLGKHRYNNYTGARFPRVWRVRQLMATCRCNRRLRSYLKPGMETKPRLMPYGKVLFPSRFEPLPVERLSVPSS